tara:strand:- start:6874 stop:7497 length:624 start_codon:yes stop_codon:yes gene_type:complete
MSQIPQLMSGRALEHGIAMAVDHGGTSSAKMYVGGQAHAITAQAAKEGSTYDTSVHTMLGSYTIPANTLVAGSTIRVRAVTRNSDQNGTDTLQIFVSLGANTTTPASNNQLLSTNDDTVADGDFCVIDGAIQFRTVGATATGYAMWTYCQPNDQAVKCKIATTISGTAAVDTTAALVLSIDSQWSANHDHNDVELEMFIVDIVNPST